MGPSPAPDRAPPLLERDRELAALDGALAGTETDGDGRLILLEGPAGIGKSALLGRVEERAAARGHRVLKAVGTELERDFGFGVVRQLFGPLLRSLAAADRARLFAGPVALAAAIFGLAEPGDLDLAPTEASLYGLFWLVAGLAESGPMLLSIDDAHWADVASLRFIRYLAHRFDGLPALVVIADRPGEPGIQAEAIELLRGLAVAPIRPPLLSEEATATIVRGRIGAASSPAVEAACHVATGGNPLLIEAVLDEPAIGSGTEPGALAPERIAGLGSERLGAGLVERAARLDPRGPAVVRAVAVLGDGAELGSLAELAEVDREGAATILDGLAAAAILGPDGTRSFAHPMLRTAVYESIPAAARAGLNSRAARILHQRGAEPEAIAAHLLLAEPGGNTEALEVLEAAAARADERGAPESVVAYLGRALPEAAEPARRAAILHRLGRAGVALRDPASIEHLQAAAQLTEEPERALDIYLELTDVLALAGLWDVAVATIEVALARFADSSLPGVLDLEAVRAAARGYDPATADAYAADLPRLLGLVADHTDRESRQLRWVLAGVGACQDMPRETVSALVGPPSQDWSFQQNGRESSLVAQAALGLVLVDDLAAGERIAAAFEDDARRRGSLLAMIGAIGFRGALDQRRGDLAAAEANLLAATDLLQRNELSLMMLTTFLHFCLEAIVERPGLEAIADVVEELEVPPPFGQTASGAMVLDLRGAVRLARGDRAGALVSLREAEALMRPLRIGPRLSPWRSRLALALPEADRAEALALAAEDLRFAAELDSPAGEAAAMRALGLLRGGEAGIEALRRAVELGGRSASPLGRARSLTELGAALGRANQRRQARRHLTEAADLAQRCGALRLEDRIREEMRVAGAKPRRRALSGPSSLTPSEQRVAAAAAAGASNREIGQMLFVSLRTVEMHLTNTYRKLGITTRTELAAAMET
jgi:DNA-binding CsgD family transcriptional regulator